MKHVRVALLLFVLALAAAATYVPQWRARQWQAPLPVDIYPVNGDGAAATDDYIATLGDADFARIGEFLGTEAARYGAIAQPVHISVQAALRERPPAPPASQANPLAVAWWSVKLRVWAYRHARASSILAPRVRIFTLYYVGEEGRALAHSLGLQKGLIGVVHAFARPQQAAQNRVVIAHELLHTLGAGDKYRGGNLPVFPDGYADPVRAPLYPQPAAEIMAGHIALTATKSAMPSGLAQCRIGPATAREIAWTRARSDGGPRRDLARLSPYLFSSTRPKRVACAGSGVPAQDLPERGGRAPWPWRCA